MEADVERINRQENKENRKSKRKPPARGTLKDNMQSISNISVLHVRISALGCQKNNTFEKPVCIET